MVSWHLRAEAQHGRGATRLNGNPFAILFAALQVERNDRLTLLTFEREKPLFASWTSSPIR